MENIYSIILGKKMKIYKILTSHSNKWIIEFHKPIIPTIIYWNDLKKGEIRLTSLTFRFWRWWWKIEIFYKKGV